MLLRIEQPSALTTLEQARSKSSCRTLRPNRFHPEFSSAAHFRF